MDRLTWQQIPSPLVSNILANVDDYDGVVLDLEHSGFNNETLVSCIQIITLTNSLCFVRLGSINKDLIKLSLDSGANGLIFSTIESREQEEEIMRLCHYPDQLLGGRRGLGLGLANNWGLEPLTEQPKPYLIAQIETKEGVDYVCTPRRNSLPFDYYMVGCYDLSASVGTPGDFTSQKYRNQIAKLRDAVPQEKLAIHVVREWGSHRPEHYGLVAFGMDTTMILDGYK